MTSISSFIFKSFKSLNFRNFADSNGDGDGDGDGGGNGIRNDDDDDGDDDDAATISTALVSFNIMLYPLVPGTDEFTR